MKHSFITSIIGLAMVASISTTVMAEDSFSILEGIEAEAMTEAEMEKVEGKFYNHYWPIRVAQNTQNFMPLFPQAQAQFLNYATNYLTGIAPGANAVIGAGFDAAFANAPFLNPLGGSQSNRVSQRPVYNPYSQMRYQQQMQQYRYQQAQAQAQMNYRYNQGLQNTFSGLSLAGVNIGCGRAYC